MAKKGWVQGAFHGALPPGIILPYGGDSAPSGWRFLMCDGSAVSQTTYADLYAVIGHKYGADPGGGNFILPPHDGKMPIGVDSGEAAIDTVGKSTGSFDHSHTVDNHTHTAGVPSSTVSVDGVGGEVVADHDHVHTLSGETPGTDTQNPPVLAHNFIISY